MRCSDGHFYVVKFQNNPQHIRVLANELLATRLAERIGLSVPQVRVVEVTEWLIRNTNELTIETGAMSRRCADGLQFGARFVVDPVTSGDGGQVFDYLPEGALERVTNVREFAGMLCLDKWTCNTNGRQAVFSRKSRERNYRATFIDQGFCFHAGDWTFSDSPLRGVFLRNAVYAGVTGWPSFEPWLTRMEEMKPQAVWRIAELVPPEWYEGNTPALEQLIEKLLARRSRIRELIAAFRDSDRNPFPLWDKSGAIAVPQQFNAAPPPRFVM